MNFKKAPVLLLAFLFSLNLVAQEKYKPTWESLAKHINEPEWFKDAKFGIYFHWGPYSVPAFDGSWYPCWMYWPNRKGWGEEVYKHHRETYGKDFNYHDFIPMFKGENFDAAAWADLFQNAGARFAGLVAIHHLSSCPKSATQCSGHLKMGRKRNGTKEQHSPSALLFWMLSKVVKPIFRINTG